MEFSELIKSRRSIRKYKPDASVSRDDIEEIIRSAQLAPSWKNSQTGRYYAVISPEKIAEVRECLPEFNRNNSENAPALIVTAFERARSGFERDGKPSNELGDKWGAYDLGLQNENLILKARDMGYDTLIMGIRDGERLRRILDIPEGQDIVSVISVGIRAIDPDAPQRKPIDEVVKFF
ncbi:MAG: nitroreductase family protein [Oscillospiraceae bacterium]|nr:nitroreductase family protein [Oscillospiraceae bacterium]